MESINVEQLATMREGSTVVLPHALTGLGRGLEHGESVVLVSDGERYAAQVREIRFEIEDTVYVLDLGSRLPEDLAEERVAGLDPDRHDLGVHEVVDLLGDLRDVREGRVDGPDALVGV
ncbi:MAG: hypothetical protein ACXVW1_01665 [Nocardioides sp.]